MSRDGVCCLCDVMVYYAFLFFVGGTDVGWEGRGERGVVERGILFIFVDNIISLYIVFCQ